MKFPIIIFLFFLSSQIITVNALLSFSPTWMKTATYVEYESDPYGLIFLNNTALSPMQLPNDKIVFRWECIEMLNNIATLNVSLKCGNENTGIHLSEIINVNTLNREVFLSNGTSIGTTRLWFVPNPIQGQEVIFWNTTSEEIVGTIDTHLNNEPMLMRTPQGIQRSYYVNANGTINGRKFFTPETSCDFNTGVAILVFFDREPMLRALGVQDVSASAELVDTNIDLGPRETKYDILEAIPYLAITATVVIVFIVVHTQRKKRKH